MQVALSIREGTLSSTLLLRRLGTESHRNNIYKAFREVGRVIRTITLLRFISEPKLREEITAATNKAEAYNGFPALNRPYGSSPIENRRSLPLEHVVRRQKAECQASRRRQDGYHGGSDRAGLASDPTASTNRC